MKVKYVYIIQEYSEYNDTDYPKVIFATTDKKFADKWTSRADKIFNDYRKFVVEKIIESERTGRKDMNVNIWRNRNWDLSKYSGFIYESTILVNK